MTLGRYFGWSSLAIATLAIAVLPDVLSLPEPDHAIVLDHAIYQSGNDDGKPVSLPHATIPNFRVHPLTVRYLMDLHFSTMPDEDLFLYIPTVNRPLFIELNGAALFNTTPSAFWAGPLDFNVGPRAIAAFHPHCRSQSAHDQYS